MGFFRHLVHIIALADICDHRDDFAVIILFQPRNDDGGIQSSGIGQYNFLTHDCSLKGSDAARNPAVKVKSLFARAYGSPPDRKPLNRENRSRLRQLLLRGGPEDSA